MVGKVSKLRNAQARGYRINFIEFRHHGKRGYTLVMTLARQNNCVLVQICADGKSRAEALEGAFEMGAASGIDLTRPTSSVGLIANS